MGRVGFDIGALADDLDPQWTGAAAYHDAPDRFMQECVLWHKVKGGTGGPTHYQLGNARELVARKRLAVRGPHGLGKTAWNAQIVLWFSITRDALGEDWKCPTTASVQRQLEKYLWPEIHKWSRVLDWDKLERDPFTPTELMTLTLKLATGQAFAVSCNDPAAIEGVHADQVLYIYDEAKAIPDATFDASEGAFSGAGDDTDAEALAVASSTPGEPQGRFYDIQMGKEGFEDWHAVHVTLEDTIKAKRVSRKWAQQRARQWGETSAVYINRVLGNFATQEEDGVIPLRWVEAAIERWREVDQDDLSSLNAVGVDVSEAGKDKTIMAPRHGDVIRELVRVPFAEPMDVANHVHAVLSEAEHGPVAVVDGIGIGAGVVSRLRELGCNVTNFKASEGTSHRDMTGELEFHNVRAAAWWNLRDLLNPENEEGREIALPPDDELLGDLTAPRWKEMPSGRTAIESKDDIRKRLHRSTDRGDAVVMAFWIDQTTSLAAPIFAAQVQPSRSSLMRPGLLRVP